MTKDRRFPRLLVGWMNFCAYWRGFSIAPARSVWYDLGGERGAASVKWLAVPEYTGGEASRLNMTTVISSDIKSVGYENGTLHVRFHSGGLYEYTNVPAALYDGLMSAASHGRYFHKYIRGRYNDHRIG